MYCNASSDASTQQRVILYAREKSQSTSTPVEAQRKHDICACCHEVDGIDQPHPRPKPSPVSYRTL